MRALHSKNEMSCLIDEKRARLFRNRFVDFVVAALLEVSVLVFPVDWGCFYLESRVLNCLPSFS